MVLTLRHRALLLAGLALALIAPGSAGAATIPVTTQADAVAADGQCSLREAVTAANADSAANGCPAGSGTDTIELPAGLYTLSGGQLVASKPLTLRGAGAATTTIQGVGSRILLVSGTPDPSLTLEDLTFRGGRAPNGTTPGPVTGADGAGGNATGGFGTTGGDGGAVYVGNGTLTVLRCAFDDNRAGTGGAGGQATGGSGGAGGNGGTGTGGSGGNGGAGGAIATGLSGSVTVRDSVFTNNRAGTSGAGGAGFGGAAGSPATTSSNGRSGGGGSGGQGGSGGPGGAISASQTSIIERSTFSGNRGGDGGPGGAATGGGGGGGGSNLTTGGAGGTGGNGNGGPGGPAGNAGTINSGNQLTMTDSAIAPGPGAAGGAGGTGTGGSGGPSFAAGAAGGYGGAGVGGIGSGYAYGSTLRSSNGATIERSFIATDSETAGPGGPGIGRPERPRTGSSRRRPGRRCRGRRVPRSRCRWR